MKAIGYKDCHPIDHPEALACFDLPEPVPGPRDLLVAVEAVSVNPVDVKLRQMKAPEGSHGVLGFDAAGTVVAAGQDVTLFKVGDPVFYAGDITRAGTNAERHVVDERIVGRKPTHLTMAQAAALPLTAITAWELLFDCFALAPQRGAGDEREGKRGARESLLVIGGAGGVGSILIQLAKTLTDLRVIATASRPETIAWVKKMGADDVLDHHQSLPEQLQALGVQPQYIAALTASDRHYEAMIEAIAPRGKIGMIDDPQGIDILKAKPKALSLHWEFMFTRSMFKTEDMIVQHHLLTQLADLVDAGKIVTTLTDDLGPMTVQSLKDAHRHQESGRAIGKTVLGAF